MTTNNERGGAAPLAGVRVLDLTRLLPGGFATSLLADLGAEVIKIEQPGIGDPMREEHPRVGHTSAYSWVTDRNKRSIALNLKEPAAVEAFKVLVATADVLVEGFRPGVMERLGLGYDDMRTVRRPLVYCSISGYGRSGPLMTEAGHDINYVGRAGILSITGPRDGPGSVPGVQVADLAGGSLMALAGLLAALFAARASGQGDHVDVSMTDGAFALLSIMLGEHFVTGESPGREALLLNGAYPCYAVYVCADGLELTVGAIEPKFFAELCLGIGRPELMNTRLDSDALPTWRALFAQRPRADWLALLAGRDACVGPVNDFAAAAGDEQLLARAMVVEAERPDGGTLRQVGTPIKLRNSPPIGFAPPPILGEGTRELLLEAGVSSLAIDELLATGAAGAA